MNPIIEADIAAQLEELTPIAEAPAGDLGYGRDLSCVSDCDDEFIEVASDTPLIIAQALARRFLTPRGTLLDDADYGCDLRGMLNRGVTQEELRSLHTRVTNEAIKDERVEIVTVSASIDTANTVDQTVQISMVITPRDPRIEPFAFVLRVTEAQVLLELSTQGG